MPAPRRRPSPTRSNGNAPKRARLVPDSGTAILVDDTSDVEIVEVINISDTEVEPVLSTAPRRDAVDPNHAAQKNLYFAVVRGMVRGECWSGVTSCATCAYSAIRFAPKGASSYVVPVRRQKEAYTIVEEESVAAQISAHDKRSVDPEFLDVIVYTDGSVIDANSKMVQKMWMTIANGKRTVYSGYGVFFAQDCAFNACGPVPGEQNVERSELYAVCVALETIVENMSWAGRVLVRTDAKIQYIPKMSRTLAKEKYRGVKNADVWKRIETSLRKLEDRDVVVIFEWIKSHAMSWGNYSADRLAKAGALADLSVSQQYDAEANIRWETYKPKPVNIPPEKYEKSLTYADLGNVTWVHRQQEVDNWKSRKRVQEVESCLTRKAVNNDGIWAVLS